MLRLVASYYTWKYCSFFYFLNTQIQKKKFPTPNFSDLFNSFSDINVW